MKDISARSRRQFVVAGVAALAICGSLIVGRPLQAQSCSAILGLLQQGHSTEEIARVTGWQAYEVEACRRELSRPIIIGPSGMPPKDAAGVPPRNAPGPPPSGGAVGPPPVGAPGPPPVGREVQRLK